jgi:phosphoribosylformimino-5-aminoimidazole carboxamide ribotide isomerase
MRIIPAIDIIDGKCVRLTKGEYSSKKIYNNDPLEVARTFEDAGVRYLHLVDLDGAKARKILNHKVLETLAIKTNLHIDFGGGIGSTADVDNAFQYGAMQVTVGSIAARNPELMRSWLQHYGAHKIILGADCRNDSIAISGWTEQSGDQVLPFINQYEQQGAKYCIVTDIDKDGMLTGPSFKLYQKILSASKIALIASGGISSIQDLKKLKAIGCSGAIIGKALYEGKITISQLKELCSKNE